MSRDTTAWSVKGIDQATRDIARRAAHAAGMTIGEWIDHAIKSDATNRGVVVASGTSGAPEAPRPDGISADTAEAIFSRIADGEQLFEARLRPIGYALKDVAERVVALERDVEQLPSTETRRIAPPDVSPSEDRRPEPPRPIELRPVAPPPTPAPSSPEAPDSVIPDNVWTSEAETRSTRPRPIEFRPVPPPGSSRPDQASTEADDSSESLSFDALTPEAPRRGDMPSSPPADWEPALEIDREELARKAGAQTGSGDIPEPQPPASDFPPELVEDDPTTLRQRPEAVPPAYDFPADPIDTRSVGLSGERIEPPGPRRIASTGRLAIAVCIAVALLGGAMWSAHREGNLNFDAIGARLSEAEHTLHHALINVSDWVVAQLSSLPMPSPPPGAPEQPAPDTRIAEAPPPKPDPAPAQPAPPAPPPAASAESADAPPKPAAPEASGPASTDASTPDAERGAVPEPSPTAKAPPLPKIPIPVDPRPVAPPPAPSIANAPPSASGGDENAASSSGATPLRRAEAGHPAAQFEVAAGMMRAEQTRPAEAATWFREAAINGLDVAQFNLGVMYELGVGVPEDQTRALLWYHSAAEQGHPLAQFNLGRLYAFGKGIPQSDTEAKRWFSRAADRGVAAAVHALATFEAGDNGRERMMHRAAKAGDPLAQAWLRARSSGENPEVAIGPPAGLVLDPPTGAPDVSAIQQGLADLGYYDGPIDGIAGPMTRAAIGRFQSDNGLPATGLPSRSLRQRLN